MPSFVLEALEDTSYGDRCLELQKMCQVLLLIYRQWAVKHSRRRGQSNFSLEAQVMLLQWQGHLFEFNR